MESVHLTLDEIKKLTFEIGSLDQAQREKIRHLLAELHGLHSGTIYRDRLHKELMKLRNAYVISDIDLRSVEDAVFG